MLLGTCVAVAAIISDLFAELKIPIKMANATVNPAVAPMRPSVKGILLRAYIYCQDREGRRHDGSDDITRPLDTIAAVVRLG